MKQNEVNAGTHPIANSADKELVLNHFIWGVIHEKGYGMKAVSKGWNVSIYAQRFEGHFVPLRQSTTMYPEFQGAKMLLQSISKREVMLSRIIKHGRDEFGRHDLLMNHTIVLPKNFLRGGRLTLGMGEKSMIDFEAKNPEPESEMEQIKLPLREKGSLLGAGIGSYLSEAAVETLATRMMKDPASKTLLICRGSNAEARERTAYLLTELLDFACNLAPIAFITEPPTLSAIDTFNLVVSARGIDTGPNPVWGAITSDVETPALKPAIRRGNVYKRIKRAFA